MATQRYISTSFWTDKWIRTLNPSDRYLYLYLMTNPQTNIAGAYQITLDRIAFDTGYDERTLRPMLERFQKAKKAYFFQDEWVILPSWPKHQKWEIKPTIKKGIDLILEKLPKNVKSYMISIGYQYPMIGYPYSPSYLDSDSDLDSDLDTDTDLDNTADSHESDFSEYDQTSTINQTDFDIYDQYQEPDENRYSGVTEEFPPSPQKKELSPMKDYIANVFQEVLTTISPTETWGNFARERKSLNDLSKKTTKLYEIVNGYSLPEDLAKDIIREFLNLIKFGKNDFWKSCPPIPSSMIARWSQITTSLAKREQEQISSQEFDASEIVF